LRQSILNGEYRKTVKFPGICRKILIFFEKKTIGGVTVMGRNTFFSIKKHPLPNRINCVVSTTLTSIKEVKIFKSLENVIREYDDFWIIGGAQLYNYALKNNLADYILITHIRKNYNADKFINKHYFDNFSKTVISGEEEYSIVNYTKKQ
jgi:dihydrofolate reductase